jgi:hypothetical protein
VFQDAQHFDLGFGEVGQTFFMPGAQHGSAQRPDQPAELYGGVHDTILPYAFAYKIVLVQNRVASHGFDTTQGDIS